FSEDSGCVMVGYESVPMLSPLGVGSHRLPPPPYNGTRQSLEQTMKTTPLIVLAALLFFARVAASQDAASAPRLNMVGPYGAWLSEKVLGDGPARLSFRTGKWKS